MLSLAIEIFDLLCSATGDCKIITAWKMMPFGHINTLWLDLARRFQFTLMFCKYVFFPLETVPSVIILHIVLGEEGVNFINLLVIINVAWRTVCV